MHRFRSFPRRADMPRALLPPVGVAPAKRLLRPRSTDSGLKQRLQHATISAAPPALVAAASTPVAVCADRTSPTIDVVEDLVPGAHLACFLGNKSNSGRCSLHAFVGQHLRAIAKLVSDGEGRVRVSHEASILVKLRRFDALRGSVPRLEARLTSAAGEVLITDAFMGRPGPTSIDASLRSWLAQCAYGAPRAVIGSTLVTQALEAAEINGNLALARHATSLLGDATALRSVTHGDFVPWNILVAGGRAHVFDWEYGVIDGVPGWDELFFEVQVALVLRRCSSADIATIVAEVTQHGFGGFSKRQARGLAVLVLLALADRYSRRGDEARQRVVNDVATQLA